MIFMSWATFALAPCILACHMWAGTVHPAAASDPGVWGSQSGRVFVRGVVLASAFCAQNALDIASAVGWNVLSTFEVPEEHSGGRVHHERGTFTLDSRRWCRLDNTEAKASYAIMNDSNFIRHFQVFKLSQSELQVGLQLSYKLTH